MSVATAEVNGTARITAKPPKRTPTTETREERDERREPDRLPDRRVDDVVLELADDDEPEQRECGDVQGLGDADGEDEDRTDDRADQRHDLDQADECADEQPVVEADDVEAGREDQADREDHQEAEPRVRAEPAVEREVRLPRLLALRLGCERGEHGDDRVPLGDAVPGGGEREEDRYDRLACLMSVRRDRVEELRPRRESMQVKLQPGEHAVADTDRLPAARAGDRAVAERVADLVQGRRHREPEEQRNQTADDEEVKEDPERLGDPVPAEPVDARPDRGRQCHREQQQDEDAPHLPDPSGERDHGERGGGGLGNADGEVSSASQSLLLCRVERSVRRGDANAVPAPGRWMPAFGRARLVRGGKPPCRSCSKSGFSARSRFLRAGRPRTWAARSARRCWRCLRSGRAGWSTSTRSSTVCGGRSSRPLRGTRSTITSPASAPRSERSRSSARPTGTR